jgi:hypothetical protein
MRRLNEHYESAGEVDRAVEREVENRIRNMNDHYLCAEILCEFDARAPEQFLPFLKAVREQDRFEIGRQLLAYIEMHFESLIDRSDLAVRIAEDARMEAVEAQRAAKEAA